MNRKIDRNDMHACFMFGNIETNRFRFEAFPSLRDFNPKSNQIESNQYIEHHCFASDIPSIVLWKWFALIARTCRDIGIDFIDYVSLIRAVSGMLICVFASNCFFFAASSFPLEQMLLIVFCFCFCFLFSFHSQLLFAASNGMWALHSSNSDFERIN